MSKHVLEDLWLYSVVHLGSKWLHYDSFQTLYCKKAQYIHPIVDSLTNSESQRRIKNLLEMSHEAEKLSKLKYQPPTADCDDTVDGWASILHEWTVSCLLNYLLSHYEQCSVLQSMQQASRSSWFRKRKEEVWDLLLVRCFEAREVARRSWFVRESLPEVARILQQPPLSQTQDRKGVSWRLCKHGQLNLKFWAFLQIETFNVFLRIACECLWKQENTRKTWLKLRILLTKTVAATSARRWRPTGRK